MVNLCGMHWHRMCVQWNCANNPKQIIKLCKLESTVEVILPFYFVFLHNIMHSHQMIRKCTLQKYFINESFCLVKIKYTQLKIASSKHGKAQGLVRPHQLHHQMSALFDNLTFSKYFLLVLIYLMVRNTDKTYSNDKYFILVSDINCLKS